MYSLSTVQDKTVVEVTSAAWCIQVRTRTQQPRDRAITGLIFVPQTKELGLARPAGFALRSAHLPVAK